MNNAKLLTIRTGFDKLSGNYDLIYDNWIVNWMRDYTRKIITQYTAQISSKSPKKCLEIGCGTGHDALWFIKNDWNITCTDISPNMCKLTSLYIERMYGSIPKTLSVLPISSSEIYKHFEYTEKFDLCYSAMGALNCEFQLLPFLKKLTTILKPQGKIIVSMLNRYGFWNNILHLLQFKAGVFRKRDISIQLGEIIVPTKLYTINELESIFSQYYQVELIRTFPSILPSPNLFRKVKSSKFLSMLSFFDQFFEKTLLRGFGDHILVVASKLN